MNKVALIDGLDTYWRTRANPFVPLEDWIYASTENCIAERDCDDWNEDIWREKDVYTDYDHDCCVVGLDTTPIAYGGTPIQQVDKCVGISGYGSVPGCGWAQWYSEDGGLSFPYLLSPMVDIDQDDSNASVCNTFAYSSSSDRAVRAQ